MRNYLGPKHSVRDRKAPCAPLGKNQCCSSADLGTQFILGSAHQKCLVIKQQIEERGLFK